MDWLTFTDHLMQSILSWPVAVVVSVLLLRTEIAGLMSHLRNLALKAGPVELTVEQELSELTATVVEQVGTDGTGPPKLLYNSQLMNRLEELEKAAQNAPPLIAADLMITAYDALEQWLKRELDRFPAAPNEDSEVTGWLPFHAVQRGMFPAIAGKSLQLMDEMRKEIQVLRLDGKGAQPDRARRFIAIIRKFAEAVSQAPNLKGLD